LAGPMAAARAISDLEQHISEQLSVHPDQQTLTSLPGAGSVRAAHLLAEIGDSRARFPTPDASAQCLPEISVVRGVAECQVDGVRSAARQPQTGVERLGIYDDARIE